MQLYRRRPKYSEMLVARDTDIVIEGFPRSANTYAVAAFSVAQAEEKKIARHTHAPAQLEQAVRLMRPTVVLIRRPADAIASYKVREPELSLSVACKEYAYFYKTAYRLKQHLVFVDFDTVIGDFNLLVRKVNRKFLTDFETLNLTQDEQQRINDLVEALERSESGGELRETHVARPSTMRHESTRFVKEQLEAKPYVALMSECNEIFRRCLDDC